MRRTNPERAVATDGQPVPVRLARDLASRIITWQKRYGRHNLPWQKTRDPYRIWISEIMLQQTQVEIVKTYYESFLNRFPTVSHLARARRKTVLRHFAGLGYYARARNLHETARRIVQSGKGFPTDYATLVKLPGIGPSTAGAILSLSCNEPHPILDGNVRRLLARLHLGRDPERNARETARLWALARELLPTRNAAVYTQGVMDLGALLCHPRNPACNRCPLTKDCRYRSTPDVRRAGPGTARTRSGSRRMRLLLLRRSGRLLLERRPPDGIWGDLSCLPEIPPDESPCHWYRRLAAPAGGRVVRHPPWRHPLTHLELSIEVYEMDAKDDAEQLLVQPTHWVTGRQLRGEPLPRPIQRFLATRGLTGLPPGQG